MSRASGAARLIVPALVVNAAVSAGHAQAPAASWPGLWGPARNGAAAGAAIAAPRSLKQLWRRPAAGGYSEIVSAGDRVFTLELREGSDHILALDARTGAEQWRTRIADTYRGHEGSHDGPIATPAVEGSDLLALGPHGTLVAVDTATGRERWRRDLVKEYGASAPAYGFAASPLIEGRLVIVPAGGPKSQGVLAFERATGQLAWSVPHAKREAYSSAVAATLAGIRQVIVAAGDDVVAVVPADGRVLWRVAGPGSEEVNNSPIVLPDDRVLLTFWGEAVMLKITRQGDALTATDIWRSPRLGRSQGPTIHHAGFLYGFAGPQLLCMDAATGEVRWRQRVYEGTLAGIGPHLLMLSRFSGDLHVLRATPDAFSEVFSTPVFTAGATSITGPAIAGRRVFLRNVEEIAAFEIEG